MDQDDQPSPCFTFLQANQSYNDHSGSNNFFDRPLLSNTQSHVPLHARSTLTPSNDHHSVLDHNQEKYHNHYNHQEQNVVDEKRVRRMVSNRESARRSRMRKRKQIEELQFQVDQLMRLNHQLSEKIISLLENNHQILQENAQLKEKVSSLQLFMADKLLPMRNVEEISTRDMNHMRAEASQQPLGP